MEKEEQNQEVGREERREIINGVWKRAEERRRGRGKKKKEERSGGYSECTGREIIGNVENKRGREGERKRRMQEERNEGTT